MKKIDLSKENIYSRCAARFNDLIYIALKDKSLDKKMVSHTRLVGIDAGEALSIGDWAHATAGMCVVRNPSDLLVVVSPDGEVLTYVGGNQGAEKISPKPFEIRGLAVINGHAFACGMKREVYSRNAKGQWKAISAPFEKGKEVVGFEAMAGFDEQEMYAVGWGGEIWEFSKKEWIQRESPVAEILTGIRCAEDGMVYICGRNGTLLKGRHNKWEAFSSAELTDDCWDIISFKNRIFVSTMTSLWELNGSQLSPVNFGKKAPVSCYRLTAAEGVMWSLGQQDLYSFDGKKWEEVD